MNEQYISNQISVYKTDKKLLSFVDKLNLAPTTQYARLHAQGDSIDNGKKLYSTIGIVLLDYSNGTGEKTVKTEANISPEESMYIFTNVQSGILQFKFSQEKIFGQTDDKGLATMRKLRILRATTDSKGQPRKYPWYIEVDNGKGELVRNKNGGTYCKSGSFRSERKTFVNLNDLDFYKILCRVNSYIQVWEVAMGAKLVKEGRTALEVSLAESAKYNGGKAV